ncbi:hypothetical protein [Cohnella sp. AR92]|uniref:hypothetical protein n=1 Tax=Cohnella sp. AR92 TaxID=648716 RepID=UPI001EE11201|nr:hypothetical protein [Cohnella sp. AR92]
MHRLSDPSSGINAVQLTQLIRVTYKTAYAMLDKIRQSLLSTESDLRSGSLSGSIEAGLAIWGREKLSSLELGDHEQPVAAGVACDSAGQPVQIALMEVSRSEMLDRTMTPMGCHRFKSRFVSPDPASQKTTVYRSKYLTKRHCKTLASICKAGFKRIQDTYHGVSLRNLGKYLAEFTFRWNALRKDGQCLRHMAVACLSSRLPVHA